MLLFLLSFYLHYDLFNCDTNERNAKFDESLIIDKHHQNLLQVNAFLKEVQRKILEKSVSIVVDYGNETTRDEQFVYDNITESGRSKASGIYQKEQNPKAHKNLPPEFHPSPQNDPSDYRQGLFHGLPPVFRGFKVPLPPLVIPRPSSLYPMALKNAGQRPPHPGYSLRPVRSLYPRLPPRFLPDYIYQNIYLRPPAPYIPSPSYTPGHTRPKGPPFLYAVGHFLHTNPDLLNPLLPTISPPISDPAVSSRTPVTILSSTISTTTIGHNAKIWLKEIAPYTPINEKIKNPSKGQSPPDRSDNTTVSIADKMSKINDNWFSTGTASTGLFFNEDKHGFLNVTPPEKDRTPVNVQNVSTNNWMSTTAGDVLDGKITVQTPSTPLPKKSYLDLMEQLDEGYMMVFMIELCRIIAEAGRNEVRKIKYLSTKLKKS